MVIVHGCILSIDLSPDHVVKKDLMYPFRIQEIPMLNLVVRYHNSVEAGKVRLG